MRTSSVSGVSHLSKPDASYVTGRGWKSTPWYAHNMSERTSLTFWCFILQHLALVPVHPVLGSDAGEGHLIYLPDESENIKFSAVAYALPHIDGTEYVGRPSLSGRWVSKAPDLPEWSNEAVLSSDLYSHNSSRVPAVAISGIAVRMVMKSYDPMTQR